MKMLVTGGCGFIGSNFTRRVLGNRPGAEVTVFDLLTYAGNLENLADLEDDPRFRFIHGDVADGSAVAGAVADVDVVVNFAAESHVDRSILDAAPFIRTNVVGTQTLLDAARAAGVARFIQISTDEVYGSLAPDAPPTTESSPLAPNSPYSASKAGADCLVRAHVRTYGTDAVIVRSSNAYGPYQFPEKLIPLMIARALEGTPLPVYGDGLQVRDWVHVFDLCDAILAVSEQGKAGGVYNVGGGVQATNLQVVREIVRLVGADPSRIRFVEDRPGHDRRYAMDHSRITTELGWTPQHRFAQGLADTVSWYRAHAAWADSVHSGAYREYFERRYRRRLEAGATQPRPLADSDATTA